MSEHDIVERMNQGAEWFACRPTEEDPCSLAGMGPLEAKGTSDAMLAAAAEITALRARLSSAEAERDRLREGLVAIRDGDVPRPVGVSWFPDKTPSKHDKCVHGAWMYDECAECVSAVANALLTPGTETR